LSPGKILVVDDDPDVREMIQFVLESAGYATVGAEDGAAALDCVHSGRSPPLALIFLDLRMPRVNGVEFMRALTADPGAPRVPVVLLSGDGRARDIAPVVGAAACLTKPVDVNDILELVHRLVPQDPAPQPKA
jgi:CheY-like chemotaxis protein